MLPEKLAKLPDKDNPGDSVPLWVSQFECLLLLLLRMKAWRAIFLAVPIAAVLSIIYLPALFNSMKLSSEKRKSNDNKALRFYGTSDFAASGRAVYLDRATLAKETEALVSIMRDRVGSSINWLKVCESVSKCKVKLVDERDSSVVGYIRYPTSASNVTALECLSTGNSVLMCALLYQIMAQAVQKSSLPGGTFSDVQFFTLNTANQERESPTSTIAPPKMHENVALPESVCATWVAHGGVGYFKMTLSTILSLTIGLTTIGLSFYLLVSTVFCVRSLKTDGFFHHLVRSGLSPSAYSAAIWSITLVECALVSGIFVVSSTLNCPEAFAVWDMVKVLLNMTFYCLTLAALILLLELLIPSLMAISLLLIILAISVLIASQLQPIIEEKWRAAFLLPLLNAQTYAAEHMARDVMRRAKQRDHISGDDWFYVYIPIVSGVALLAIVALTAFLENLLKSGNGQLLPAYFPCSPRFWRPRATERQVNKVADEDGDASEPHIEQVTGLSASIVAKRIVKTYAGCLCAGPIVLNGLSCKIYKNQITALIGHNGAGKSTLIKILTGEESSDGGAAYINGVNVTDPLDRLALRGSISICPQFDALCGSLTVLESIRVTLNCHGSCSESQVARARTMLRRLGLHDKENVMSTELSGGQKRKVNAILALIGRADVVFLDEPTSGLDPVSRRQLWQLLQEEKVGRSIVLCTQFMDEADVLADRKIFISGGHIVCAGSSMFLKRAFGCSFTLNVSLKSKSSAQAVIASLRRAQLRSQFETELLFEVPASSPDALVEAVQVLESSQGIEAFGVSQATLDDIFMKLSGVCSVQVIDAFLSGDISKFLQQADNSHRTKDMVQLGQTLKNSTKVEASNFQQFRALLRINLKKQVRTKGSLCSRFVLPVILLAVLGMSVYQLSSSNFTKGVIRMRMGSNYTAICVVDGPVGSYHSEVACPQLVAGDSPAPTAVLNKSESESLQSFLSSNHSIQAMKGACKIGPDTPCMIYYATSWSMSVPNNQRKVSIGMFLDRSDARMDHLYGYMQGFQFVSKLFGAGDIASTTSVAHVEPLSNYLALEGEMILFLVIFCLFPVSYLGDPSEDLISGVRSHLTAMGMTHVAYWANTFLLHWCQYSACFAISVALLCTCDRYRNAYFIIVCLPVFFLGTASNQLIIYTIATVTKSKSTIVSLSCSLVAIILPICFVPLSIFNMVLITALITLLPPAAPIALIYFSVRFVSYYLEYLSLAHVSEIPDLYQISWSNMYIRMALIAMPIHVGIMCGVIAFAENSANIWALCCRRRTAGDADTASSVDQGAAKEAMRVMQSVRNPQDILQVRQLYKTYPNGVTAVRGVTFGTRAGEIFGLLGVNGAGKSTSMSVIVGEEAATFGECEVHVKDGAWVSGQRGASIGAIGYCPQHNPLFNCITVAEHLYMFADIRGVPSATAQAQVAALIQGLGLQPHKDKQVEQLSGGNKRRLCLAISLLGDPALIVIDEASTGVDPENKRFIWSAIRGMLHEQRSVMVTTHSMEEVEALCIRVGIMNKGRMIAFGTVQQLRSLYGDAYTLEVLLKQESEEKTKLQKEAIRTAVRGQFKGALAIEELSQCMQFSVPRDSVPRLSGALQWLATNKSKLGMDYFSFYQMSLDQVFVKLVKQYDSTQSLSTAP